MLRVDLADNPYLREKGLMYVENMPEDKGMLFIFEKPQRLNFWGKNTYIPLDIAFIDENDKIVKISSILPHDFTGVSSEVPCLAALEANQGYFEKNDIKVGNKISLHKSELSKFSEDAFYDSNWDGYKVSFNSQNESSTKDFTNFINNIKEGQSVFSDNEIGYNDQEKVNKNDVENIGKPITEEQTGKNLPVLDASILGQILEDSFDEEDKNFSEEEIQPEEQIEEKQPEIEQLNEKPEQKKYPVFSNPFEASEWASKNGEVLRISYTTKHGRHLIRDVEPHGHFHSDSSKREVLVTWDQTPGIQNIRAFLIGNISRWAFTGQKFNKKFIVKR